MFPHLDPPMAFQVHVRKVQYVVESSCLKSRYMIGNAVNAF